MENNCYKPFEKQFELRHFEMNKFGEASPITILALLEETAADHCYSINYSLYDLIDLNIGWVLIGGIMEMVRYPKYKEKITIRTWLSNYSAVRGIRENIIYDQQGDIIGRAKGLWVFFDIARRRPVPIFEPIKENWSFNTEEALIHDLYKKISPIESAQYIREFNINRYDVDMNKHVNNLRYLQWAMESIPEEIVDNYDLASIDGRFMAEANMGDRIISLSQPNLDDTTFTHTIKTDTNKVCATATTVWRPRVR